MSNRARPQTFSLLLTALLLSGLAAAPAVLPSGPQPTPLRFAVIGDQGTGDEHQFRIARQMTRWHDALPYSLVITLGDNFYGPKLLWWRHGGKQYFDDKFDEPYADLLGRGVIFRLSLGNHDVRTHDGRDIIKDTARFHIDGELGYYRFAQGEAGDGSPLVEFFVLNTPRLDKGDGDPEQLAWLRESLETSRAKWKVVYGHHPVYSTGKRHGAKEKIQSRLEPILAGRVDLALAGHEHFYERFHPQQGVAYFICGSSGELRRGNARRGPIVAAVEDQARTFMLWEVTGTELRFLAIKENGEAFDCGKVLPGGKVEETVCRPGPELTVP